MGKMIIAISLATLALVVGALGAELVVSSDGPTAMDRLPVPGPITQPFGCTSLELEPLDLDCPQRHFHSGIDISATLGTPVLAAFSGAATVLNDSWGYGLHVIVETGNTQAIYGHLSEVIVHSGDQIEAGQTIGLVGSSGNSTGSHLHFEIRVNGVPHDPMTFLDTSPNKQPNT